MAPTAITPTRPTHSGVAPMTAVTADATNGNSVRNLTGLHLVLSNPDASPHNVTFTTPGTVSGVAIDDPVVALPAGEARHFGGFATDAYGSDLVFTSDSALVEITAYQAS